MSAPIPDLPSTMQAAACNTYGSPALINLVQTPLPALPADGILVRNHATCVSSADARIRAARFPRGFGIPGRLAFGLRAPRQPILGSCFSGMVHAVGNSVHDVAIGSRLCGMTGLSLGCHAEYVVVRHGKAYAHVPDVVTHHQAAGILFGGTTALVFLRDVAKLAHGERLLVIGASGAIGTAAVQLGRIMGANVTGVTSTLNVNLVRKLGAHHVVDYTAQDVGSLPERYDVVLDTVGNLSIADGRRLLAPGGRLALAVADLAQMLTATLLPKVYAASAAERASDVAELVQHLAEGRLRTVIDAIVPLSSIASAHQRVDSGRKVGNLVVDMA